MVVFVAIQIISKSSLFPVVCVCVCVCMCTHMTYVVRTCYGLHTHVVGTVNIVGTKILSPQRAFLNIALNFIFDHFCPILAMSPQSGYMECICTLWGQCKFMSENSSQTLWDQLYTKCLFFLFILCLERLMSKE